MQVTYTLPVDFIDKEFLESIKTQFVGKDVKISIEEVGFNQPEIRWSLSSEWKSCEQS